MAQSASDKPKSNKMAVIVILGVIVLGLGFTARLVGQRLEQQGRNADRAMQDLGEVSRTAGDSLKDFP